MWKYQGRNCWAEIEWRGDGMPVIYATGHGRWSVRECIEVIQLVVNTIDTGPFDGVCTVYNLFEVNLPFLGPLVRQGGMPTALKGSHLIVGTHNQMIQVTALLVALSARRRLRTLEVCNLPDKLELAVQKWLAARKPRIYRTTA